MPVEDIEVHEKVKKTGYHEHCWNNRSTRLKSYYAQDRVYGPDGTWNHVLVEVHNRFANQGRLCRAKGGYPSPAGCIGCAHDGEDKEFEAKAEARK